MKFSSEEIDRTTIVNDHGYLEFIKSTTPIEQRDPGQTSYCLLLRRKLKDLSKVNAVFFCNGIIDHNGTTSFKVRCKAHYIGMAVSYWNKDLKRGHGIEMIWKLRCLKCCGLKFVHDSDDEDNEQEPDDDDIGTDYGESTEESSGEVSSENETDQDEIVTADEDSQNESSQSENLEQSTEDDREDDFSSIADDADENSSQEIQAYELALNRASEDDVDQAFQPEIRFDDHFDEVAVNFDGQEVNEQPNIDSVNEGTNAEPRDEILVKRQVLVNLNLQLKEALAALARLRNNRNNSV